MSLDPTRELIVPWLGFADPFSSWTHLFTGSAALFLSFPLIYRGRGNSWRVACLVIYSITLVFLFSMSGVFHLLSRDGEARDVLQRLDHAGIWTMIAGTFTPVHGILFRKFWRSVVLILVWAVAISGLVFEVIYFKSFPEALALGFFLGLGWIGVFSHRIFHNDYPSRETGHLIWLGGLSYTFGAVIDFMRWPSFWPSVIGPHEVFHIFVSVGASLHWFFIWKWANHPVTDHIRIDVTSDCNNKLFEAFGVNERLHATASSKEILKDILSDRIKLIHKRRGGTNVTLRYFNIETLPSSRPELNSMKIPVEPNL